jgi:hypothetical protein
VALGWDVQLQFRRLTSSPCTTSSPLPAGLPPLRAWAPSADGGWSGSRCCARACVSADATGIRRIPDPLAGEVTPIATPSYGVPAATAQIAPSSCAEPESLLPNPARGAFLDAASGERPSPREPDVFEDAVHRGRATGGAPWSSTQTASTLRGHSRSQCHSRRVASGRRRRLGPAAADSIPECRLS